VAGNFPPLRAVELGEPCVAADSFVHVGQQQRVGATNGLPVELRAADDERGLRLLLPAEVERGVEIAECVDTVGRPELRIAREHDVRAARQRLADRLVRFAAHDDRIAHC